MGQAGALWIQTRILKIAQQVLLVAEPSLPAKRLNIIFNPDKDQVRW